MPQLVPTFVREGNTILAFFEDRIIASGTNFAAVEESAVDYLDHLKLERDTKDAEAKKASAKYIVTPSGLKGEILGTQSGVWGKEITARLENGRIVRLEAHAGLEYQAAEAPSSDSALEYLEGTLNQTPEGTKSSLVARINDLDELVAKASAFQRTASYEDQRKASDIVIAAEHEKREVRDALSHLETSDAEAFAPPAPFRTGAVEQASLGGGSGTWLDETMDDMIREAADVDFDKLLLEGPGQFVVDLDLGALADQGVTHEMALSHIVSKTAAFQGDEVESYREQFLAKVEEARRGELADRTETAKAKAEKTAAKEEAADATPDEALFF